MTRCVVCGAKKYLATHGIYRKGYAKVRIFWVCIGCHRAIHDGTINLEEEIKKKQKEPWSVS